MTHKPEEEEKKTLFNKEIRGHRIRGVNRSVEHGLNLDRVIAQRIYHLGKENEIKEKKSYCLICLECALTISTRSTDKGRREKENKEWIEYAK